MAADDGPQVPAVKVNARGQHYGSLYGVQPGQEPDLVSVATEEGVEGYILFDEIKTPDFKSPEEALAWQRARGPQDKWVTVYSSDGVTKVGKFRVSGTGGVVTEQ